MTLKYDYSVAPKNDCNSIKILLVSSHNSLLVENHIKPIPKMEVRIPKTDHIKQIKVETMNGRRANNDRN